MAYAFVLRILSISILIHWLFGRSDSNRNEQDIIVVRSSRNRNEQDIIVVKSSSSRNEQDTIVHMW